MQNGTDNIHKMMKDLPPKALQRLRGQVDAKLRSLGLDPFENAQDAQSCRLFTVPPGVKHLSEVQLERLSKAFEDWLNAATDARTRRSRLRIWLIFQLLRYSGGRLGEVLALDDRRDFNLERSVVIFREGAQSREVVLPEAVLHQIDLLLQSPELLSLRGKVFSMDQGFVRRKFYEQTKATGLPRELLNPRVLRNSRAVELFREGVPLRAVQAMLAYSAPTLDATFLHISDKDMQRIAHHFIAKETTMKTSARNTFVGEVVDVDAGPIACWVSLLTAAGTSIRSVITHASMDNLDVVPGNTLAAIVKAPLVHVEQRGSKGDPGDNLLPGEVTELRRDGQSAEILVRLEDETPMCSMVLGDVSHLAAYYKGQLVQVRFSPLSVILTAA